ncbi:hypothetical protein AC1031_007466 [Aphanomyces cochlioides]|nr:hypothetical protein AC1031_007466 [Aphanomyces cochlioides]
MANYPLRSADWSVVEHGVLSLWKDVWSHLQNNEEQATASSYLVEDTTLWHNLSYLLNCKIHHVEHATVHCIHGLFSLHKVAQLTLRHRIQESLVVADCIDQLCIKLVAPYDIENSSERRSIELVALTLANICSLAHQVERVCAAGALDVFTFIVLDQKGEEWADHVQTLQLTSLRCITSCVQLSMACLEDIEHSSIFEHVLARVVPLSDDAAAVGMSFLATCMNHQPLICKLLFDRGILPLILAMLHSNPQLQLQALRALNHLLSCPVDIATQTMTQMRLSGALINICWLFTFHHDPKVNRAASDVLESLIKWTPEVGKRLIEDLCEQGCVLLLQQKPTRHYQWVINNLDQESLNLLLTTLTRTKNSLLRSNLLVSVLVLAVSSKTKQLQLDEWWPTLLSLMADPNVLNHLLNALVTLCNPETIPQSVSSNTQRPFDGPLRLKWSDEEYIVSKSAMAHNSHTIHSKLLKEPTCTVLNMPAMSSPCKKSFRLVCQLSSPKLAGLEQTVLVELASVAQKLGMQSLLNATIDQLKVAHLPVNILQQEGVVLTPVIILHWLNYLHGARKALENDEYDFLVSFLQELLQL